MITIIWLAAAALYGMFLYWYFNWSGPLSEAEIHARLCEALGAVTPEDLAPLAEAAKQGAEAYAQAFFARVFSDARLRAVAPVILYRTLGPTLPEGMAESAVLWGAIAQAALKSGPSMARAGFDGSPARG